MKPITPSGRDFPEDFPHENGQYIHTCIGCKEAFMGHKRRCVCKECSTPPVAVNEAACAQQMGSAIAGIIDGEEREEL